MSQGRADDLEAPGGSVEQSRTTKGAEELRVDSTNIPLMMDTVAGSHTSTDLAPAPG